MKFLGIALTSDDMARIVSSIAAMSINLVKNADSHDDIVEAAELFKLHLKLVGAMTDATRKSSDDGDDEN